MGSDFGGWVPGTLLLADTTWAAVRELLFFLPLGAPAQATLAYDCWGLEQSGARCPAMKVVGSGYLLSRNAFASHESGNLSAYSRGSPEKDRVATSYLGMSGSKEEGRGPLLGGVPALWACGEVVWVHRTEDQTAQWGLGPAVWLH